MPVQYGAILDEVRSVRSACGVFDVSHMGQVHVSGRGALAAIQNLLTNDASKLTESQAQYSLLCRDDGGILDDLIVYRWDRDGGQPEFLIVVNASNRETDFAWMQDRGASRVAAFTDVSDDYALIAVQGPQAETIVGKLVDNCDLASLRPFSHTPAVFAGGLNVHLARTGYTGEDGFEVFCAPDAAEAVWSHLVESGAAPCGLGARDVLRIEASYPLYGHEITQETNPYEAGLGWVVKPAKGDFIGRDAMVAAKQAGLQRSLAGILPEDHKAIPRQGTSLETDRGKGVVTSGTMSTTLGRAIGMAYVPKGATGSVSMAMRGKQLPASIVKLPFYRRGQ
jgi:aminomethyltransferase